MTTRALILSPHEVRAALDGRLGLVVRPVKHKTPCLCGHPLSEHQEAAGYTVLGACGKFFPGVPCPLGVPGDRLWCRETYCFKRLSHIPKTHTEVKCSEGPCYRGVTGGLFCHRDVGRDGTGSPLWMSPATMPAWASRITLDVTGVRCVRVRELCSGKGFESMAKETWDSKYAKRGLGWEINPFVWAVEVRRVEG